MTSRFDSSWHHDRHVYGPSTDSTTPCLYGTRIVGDLYGVVLERIIVAPQNEPHAMMTATKADHLAATWHPGRFGHPREQTVRDMLRGAAMTGIVLSYIL